MGFIFLTDHFETSGLALKLQQEGEEVCACIFDKDSHHVLEGLVERIDDWHDTLGKKNVYIVDGCKHGGLVEWLRSQDEFVVGGTTESDEAENDRRISLALFKKYGIQYPRARWFDSFDTAIMAVRKSPGALVFKQQGEAAKGFSYVGKFEDGTDMIDRLEYYKGVWHEEEDGPVDFLLQERVTGHEMAVGAYFNGTDWIRDARGHIVVECNFEGKKLLVGDMGATTGETTTMMFTTDETNKLFQEMLFPLTPWLKEIGYKGDIDTNCIVTEDGTSYALELTNRFGIPALDMQIGAQRSSWGELLHAIASGSQPPGGLLYIKGFTCVIVCYAPPFPFETNKPECQGAGQRIYFLKDGEWQGKDYLTDRMWQDIHPYEVKVCEDGEYRLTGPCGYVLTMTANGNDHNEAADLCLRYIKDYLTFSELSYRKDAGHRLDTHIRELKQLGYIGPFTGQDLEGVYMGN